MNAAALLFRVVEPADSNVVALKFDEVVQAWFGPGLAFVYQKSKSAVGPVLPTSESFVTVPAWTRVELVPWGTLSRSEYKSNLVERA